MGKTVRVRIAVAVAASGDCNAIGWTYEDGVQEDDEDMMEKAFGPMSEETMGPLRAYWIEADIPRPDDMPPPTTIEGTVTTVGEGE